MVRIFPNRYSDKLGAYPGVKKIKMIPIAIPNDQVTAMTESSLMFRFCDIHSTAKADMMANRTAESVGFQPK